MKGNATHDDIGCSVDRHLEDKPADPLAVAAGTLLWHFQMLGRSGGLLVLISTPDWMILLIATFVLVKSGKYDRRIDGIMRIAVSYIIWFGMIPLVASLRSWEGFCLFTCAER
jgi:hypothetical protein